MTYLSRSLEVDLGHQYAPQRTRKQAQQSDWNLTQTEVEEGTHACVGMGQVQHIVLERRSIYIHLPIHVRTQDSGLVFFVDGLVETLVAIKTKSIRGKVYAFSIVSCQLSIARPHDHWMV